MWSCIDMLSSETFMLWESNQMGELVDKCNGRKGETET